MAKILLKSVYHQSTTCDILIDGNRFANIAPHIVTNDNIETIDCKGLAIMPAFYNGHCHAAMSLFRGYADEKPLHEWLTNYIWPIEAKLNEKIVEIGSRLAILEMIHSGTVFFSDMYYFRTATMKAVEEMGIRATIGVSIADKITPNDEIEKHFAFLKAHTNESERVKLAVMPHAIYTNSEKMFRRCVQVAKEENYLLHTHLSETTKEVEDCRKEYGCSPVELLDRFGALHSDFIAAHCVHLSESDKTLFAESGAGIIVNPCSNLKLQSGIPDIAGLKRKGIRIGLGTDGASSNNNLDMQEEMKIAALIANVNAGDKRLSQQVILDMATYDCAQMYHIGKAGKIEVGFLADCILLDINDARLTPNNDILSNWIYGANSSAIDSVMCDGKFVMRHRHVDGEEDIIREAQKCAKKLIG